MTGEEKAASIDTYFAALMDNGSDDDDEYVLSEDWKKVSGHSNLRSCI